jgi:glycosyltransferase involved in cell wall biosynthesis
MMVPMPRVMRLSDDPVSGRPAIQSGVAVAGIIHADGPASVRKAFLQSLRSRLPGPGGRVRLVASGADAPGRGPSAWLTRLAVRGADRVVAASRAEAGRYVALGVPADRVHVIPPVPLTDPVASDPLELRRSLGIPESARLIVAAGRFDAAADLASAVWAFDILRYVRPEIYLVLVGDGPERARVERFARTAAFDDNRVRFAGSSCDETLGQADVVWVTHRRGGAHTLLPAMAAGRVIVAFATPDVTEFVTDGGTGRLVPPGDRVRMAAVTRELLDHPARAAALGSAARSHVTSAFPAQVVAGRLAALYDGLTPARG